MLHRVLHLVETFFSVSWNPKQQAERPQSQMTTLAGVINISNPFHLQVVMGYIDNKNTDHISVKHCVIAKYETSMGGPFEFNQTWSNIQ